MNNLELDLITNNKKLKYKKKENNIENDIQIILKKIKNIDINLLDNIKSNDTIINYIISTIKTIQYIEHVQNIEISKKKMANQIVNELIDNSIKTSNLEINIDRKILINKKEKPLDKYVIINKID